MSIYDEARDGDSKIRKGIANTDRMLSAELHNLKENTLGVADSVKSISAEKVRMANNYMRDVISDLKSSGAEALRKTESHVREKPGQSIALAFAVGVLTSLLLRSRRG